MSVSFRPSAPDGAVVENVGRFAENSASRRRQCRHIYKQLIINILADRMSGFFPALRARERRCGEYRLICGEFGRRRQSPKSLV